jgi:hypothetical protein
VIDNPVHDGILREEGDDLHAAATLGAEHGVNLIDLPYKTATVFWGFYAIGFAQFANHLGSLIEAVNILGSLFYGAILGIFLIAFYFKKIGGNATFIAALIAEAGVLACFFFTEIPYLWFTVIGAVSLVVLAHILNPLWPANTKRI